ncbi:hypothetical protein V8F20_008926 [Naviculisporaceae sp. PSN 640]
MSAAHPIKSKARRRQQKRRIESPGNSHSQKTHQGNSVPEETNWDEPYDPAHPTDIEEFLQSDAWYLAMQEWKDVLYAHRQSRTGTETMASRSISRASQGPQDPTEE